MKTILHPIKHGTCLALLVSLSFASASLVAQPAAAPEQSPASEGGIEAYVSEDAIQALYARQENFGEFGDVDLRGGAFFNEARDLVMIADVLTGVADPGRFPRWTFRVGSRLYGALLSQENQDVFSIGFGGEARYAFGTEETVAIQISGFYAPDILTFGEADNVTDVGVRLEMRLTEQLIGFVGYRRFEFDLPLVRDREIDEGLHLGIRRSFQ